MAKKSIKCEIPGVVPANSPVGHWWYQRLTAVALAPLTLWLIVFLQKALNAPYAETVHWLTSPVNAATIGLWIVLATYHAALGLRVVMEDYVSTIPLRKLAIRFCNLVLSLAALAAIIFIYLTR